MAITSAQFLLFIGLTLVTYLLYRGLWYRHAVLILASAWFIVSQSTSLVQLLPLALFLVSGYGVIWGAARSEFSRLAAIFIAAYVVLFVYVKQYTVIAFLGSPLTEPYVTIGMSYVLFRVLHLAIDTRAGLIRGVVKPWSYFLYVCSLLTFVSGPIQRYEEFEPQAARLDSHELTNGLVYKAFSRIANGLLVTLLISEPLLRLHQAFRFSVVEAADGSAPLWTYWMSATAYALYMYASFAGYMGIVIGLGLLFGFELPENFNHPFESASFLEFWSRWHITLSRWFQSYVFNPVQLLLVRRWSRLSLAPYLGVIAFFVTFLLMGMWHGSTASFFVYGLILGAGTSVNRLYQVLMQRVFGKKKYGTLKQQAPYIWICRGFTFAYFSFALSSFWLDVPAMVRVATGHNAILWLVAWTVVSIVAGAVISLRVIFGNQWRRASSILAVARESVVYKQALLTTKVAVLVAFGVVGLERTIEFVYQAF